MTTAVLDANAFISATLVPVGIPAQIVEHARARHFTIVTSAHIITETTRALTYPRIQRKYKVRQADIARLRRFLRRRTVITPLGVPVQGVATHPEDDLVLATAVSASADYLVTGDAQLQKLGAYEGVKIVSPREFLSLLEEEA